MSWPLPGPTNHLHAFVQVSNQPLGRIMQPIASRYGRYRHKAMGVTGHLFEKRYGAELIEDHHYFLAALRYIHLNPLTSGTVCDPANYRWTSHRAYLGIERIPWLTTDFGLSLFSSDAARAHEAYQRFMGAVPGTA
jgi:putative transposase